MGRSMLRQWLRGSPFLRPLRLRRVARQARSDGHFDWSDVIAADRDRWNAVRSSVIEGGQRVLIASDVGLHFGASRIDSLLAAALTLRGAAVDVLLCDGALPACMIGDVSWYRDPGRFARSGPQADFCDHCFAPAADAWRKLGIEPIRLGGSISDADRQEAAEWAEAFCGRIAQIRGDPIADQGLAGALRFYASSTLPDNEAARAVLRAFLVAAKLTAIAGERIVASGGYDVVVLHHGIYVPQGPMLAAARAKGARIVSWNVGYRTGTFIFSHGDSYHHTMLEEPSERWDQLVVSPEKRAALDEYLHSRRHGGNDWIVFGRGSNFDADRYLTSRGIDTGRPIYLALTNVAWDAQIHYPANSFDSMAEWLVATVSWFAARSDLQLVVRVHPAEITGSMPANERAADIIAAAFPSLPDNIVVVGPEEGISTYALIEASRAGIVYATKAGIEVAAMGKPLVVAGDAWARGKGFSIDVADPADYLAVLEKLPETDEPAAETVERARRYAFHYFFRRMVPIKATRAAPGWPPFDLDVASLTELEPGADLGLDIVADGILAGTPFEYPAEQGALPSGIASA